MGSAVGLGSCSMAQRTGQGACLEVIDGPQAPALREEGGAEMPGGLTRHLSEHPGEPTGRR